MDPNLVAHFIVSDLVFNALSPMVNFNHVLRGGIFWAISVNIVTAGKSFLRLRQQESARYVAIHVYIGYDVGALTLCVDHFY